MKTNHSNIAAPLPSEISNLKSSEISNLKSEIVPSEISNLKSEISSPADAHARLIFKYIARRCLVAVSLLFGHSRNEEIVWPRHVALYLSCELVFHGNQSRTYRFFRPKGLPNNHTLVRWACQNVQKRISIDEEFKTEVELLATELRQLLASL